MYKIVGIECGFPMRRGNWRIDELEKTQHYSFYATDILRAKSLGVDMIRYGTPWHRIEREKGVYDWSWIDGPIDLLQHLNIPPILDLCHFGTPDWLLDEGGFASPRFAECFSDFAEAVARRYPWVQWYTPINEPLILSRFCGRHAHWHPFHTDAFELLRNHMVDAIRQSVERIRAVQPVAIIMMNDNCEHHTVASPCCEHHNTANKALVQKVIDLNEERFSIWDRTMGYWDVIGLDYYPWTEELHYCDRKHTHHERGFYDLAKDYWQRYKKPIMIAETDHSGSVGMRMEWMERTIEDCKRLRNEDVEMIGYCWWPMIDNIDWGAFRGDGKPDNAGLYTLERDEKGLWQRLETPLVPRFRDYALK